MPKSGIIIQARMGSTRLPGKVLMPLCTKPMLEYLWENMCKSQLADQVIIATSDKAEDEAIIAWAKQKGANIFQGPEEDVLERYILAAEKFAVDIIVRATGDNPLTSVEIIDEMLSEAIKNGYDYMTMKGLPVGITAEVVTLNCLRKTLQYELLPRHHEHVTLFIKENLPLFKTCFLSAPSRLHFPDLRLTVDTAVDFLLIEKIFQKFYQSNQKISLSDIIIWLMKNPDVLAINAEIKQKNY